MIIRNGVRHNTSSFGGSGNANIVKLTQSEYDALPESKKSDGILYAITDGECSASGGSSKPVELTKAEYEALGDKVNSDGILYAITDGDGLSAKNLAYDGSETGLGNTVQDAVDVLNSKVDEQNNKITMKCGTASFSETTNAHNWYYATVDVGFDAMALIVNPAFVDSSLPTKVIQVRKEGVGKFGVYVHNEALYAGASFYWIASK